MLMDKDMKEKILNGEDISTDLMNQEVKRIAKEHYNVDFDEIPIA